MVKSAGSWDNVPSCLPPWVNVTQYLRAVNMLAVGCFAKINAIKIQKFRHKNWVRKIGETILGGTATKATYEDVRSP